MTKPGTGEARLRMQIGEATAALLRLDDAAPGAAGTLVALVRVVADEAARTPRFARALSAVLAPDAGPAPAGASASSPQGAARAAASQKGPSSQTEAVSSSASLPGKAPARRSRRAPAPFDPFVLYRDGGEAGLRDELGTLDVEALKDIIAEHAMDYDKLAMRWRTPSKLRDRIVERVKALTTKGDAFR